MHEKNLGQQPSHNQKSKPKTGAFTAGRVVALAVIGVLIAGLAWLGFTPDPDAASVPDGAEAGDLALEPCDYTTDEGTYAAECGTLVVPENRIDRQSRLISLPVTRIPSRSDDPADPIFRLEGGPGVSNMHFPAAGRFVGDRDVVMVGYRGVDGSVRLDCPEVTSAVGHSTDILGEDAFRAYSDAYRACADRLTDAGVYVAGYGLVDQVEDLEAARKAFGYERIDLVSESAGTRTAMIYASRYPESIRRSVMIGVNPPGNFVWDPETTDEQIARYADLCERDEACSARTEDLAATIRTRSEDMPDRWYLLPIDAANIRTVSFWGMMESTPQAAPASAPMIIDAWLSAAAGDSSGLWFGSIFGELMFPKAFVWGQYAAAASVDAEAARDYFSSGEGGRDANFGYAASAFAWGGGRMADAWPVARGVDEYRTVKVSDVEALLVGGELDTTTPPQVAREELLPHLPNAQEVVLPGFGHSFSFWMEQPDAGTHLIETFLDSGEVDTSLYRPQTVGLTPDFGLPAMAKVVVGGLLGLALVMIVSLLWMARRVRTRGGFGPKGGAVLRSVYPVVLGLGGWCLGVLVTTSAMSWIPIDDSLFVALWAGVPIGLGIFLAWVGKDLASPAKTAGFAVATGASLVGAGLGFAVTDGFGAVFTGIVGAIACANLALILVDISRDRVRHGTVAAASDAPAGTASPPEVPGGARREEDLVPAGSSSRIDPR
ncbi:MAG: alpha/beta fold hydrolase [Acidimicrobiia bacterium]|nr:alpha/beta fold hydrolase [Acidimicrobiia bacterium]